MRDIKFRGKGKGEKGKWFYGDYYKRLIYKSTTRKEEFINYISWQTKDAMGKIWNEYVEVDPETVGQYTGIKDDDGLDIFDGDYCLCVESGSGGDYKYLSMVKFSDGAFTIAVNGCDYDYTSLGWALGVDIDSIKVVGNNAENTLDELIEKYLEKDTLESLDYSFEVGM